MREVTKAYLKEFQSYAYGIYLDGVDIVPMDGDKFYLMEMEEGDEWEGIILKSSREETCFEWNHNGWWQQMSDEDIPEELFLCSHKNQYVNDSNHFTCQDCNEVLGR